MLTKEELIVGQRDALDDLYLIEAQDGGLSVEGWDVDDGWLVVNVIIDCSNIKRHYKPGGLVLHSMEAVQIWIPKEFPLRPPSLSVKHTRFAGYENVMNGGGICLFRSPDTEWDPGTGMAMFIHERVWGWFIRAVTNEVEQQGGTFHAPVLKEHRHFSDVIHYVADEPTAEGIWSGLTLIRDGGRARHTQSRNAFHRWNLISWIDRERPPIPQKKDLFGAALLLPERIGFYFPKTLGDLLGVVDRIGMSRRALVTLLGDAAHKGEKGQPVFFTVGVPLGVSPNGKQQHHLTTLVWTEEAARLFWDAGGTRTKDAAIDAVIRRADEFSVGVVFGRDARPGVVVRRDTRTPMNWFVGKTVAIWGVGALGGPLAIQIARSGAAKLILRDYGLVNRGLLVRQPYQSDDEEVTKVDALGNRLNEIRPDLTVCVDHRDLRQDAQSLPEWNGSVDLIINASASNPVRVVLDAARVNQQAQSLPVLTLGVDQKAERGFARLLMPETSASLVELERSTQIAVASQRTTVPYADAFFPAPDSPRRQPFYPEPGCSDSTFAGSAADMAALSGAMLNWAAKTLATGRKKYAVSLLMSQPHVALTEDCPAVHQFVLPEYKSLRDERANYEVRLAPGVLPEIDTQIKNTRNRYSPNVETGGPLWGAWDDARRIMWVDVAGPPPADSEFHIDRFVCGVDGLADEAELRALDSYGATFFVGTWHTHPYGAPCPSERDLASVKDVCTRIEPIPRRFLMLIVGSPHTLPVLRPHVFRR